MFGNKFETVLNSGEGAAASLFLLLLRAARQTTALEHFSDCEHPATDFRLFRMTSSAPSWRKTISSPPEEMASLRNALLAAEPKNFLASWSVTACWRDRRRSESRSPNQFWFFEDARFGCAVGFHRNHDGQMIGVRFKKTLMFGEMFLSIRVESC